MDGKIALLTEAELDRLLEAAAHRGAAKAMAAAAEAELTKKLVTIRQAAEALQVSQDTLRRRLQDQRITCASRSPLRFDLNQLLRELAAG